MIVEIRDPSLELRLNRQLEIFGTHDVEEVLRHLFDAQEEQDRWLLLKRDEINADIQCGLEQLDRGEGIPDNQLEAYLANLRAKAK